jgi:putative lipoic acid-binding regulatory protein
MTEPSPLTFPIEFPVKVMGRDTPDFHATIADIFARHVAPLDALSVSRQPSREGRFVSVTVVFTAESRAQLDALYTDLSGSEHILMAL